MLFWIVASLLALAVAGLLALALLRGRQQGEPPAAYDLRVYRDQLKEVDRDLARGVIAEADAGRIRTEISRRILAADARLRAGDTDGSGGKAIAAVLSVVLALGLVGGGVLIYRSLGAPGFQDLPRQARLDAAERSRESRPDQATAEASVPPQLPPEADPQFIELMKQLRAKVAEQPDDLRGQQLLAQYEYQLQDFAAARKAQAEVIRLRGADATAQEHAALGEMMILATNGYVSPEAEATLARALQLDPAHGPARFFQGLFLAQIGRPDQAFTVWDRLLRDSPPEAPWVATIEEQIADLAAVAGVEYQPRPRAVAGLSGPSQEDVEAAQDMSAEDRSAMIRNMVEGLEERLESDGGSPQEWARLIGALGVLGDPERAAAALSNAQAAFPDDAEAQTLFADAAARAGIGQ